MLDYKQCVQDFIFDMEEYLDNECWNANEKLEYLYDCENQLKAVKKYFEDELKIVPFAGKEKAKELKALKDKYDQELLKGVSEIDLSLAIIENIKEYVYDEWSDENSEYSYACSHGDWIVDCNGEC